MFYRFFLALLTLAGMALLSPLLEAATPQESGKAQVVIVPVKGEISGSQLTFLRRAFKEAERAGASAIILDMDTPGGGMDETTQIQQALSKLKARTITWVNPNALSAGSLIAISTREIYMAPVSVIGAAAPVVLGGQDIPSTMKEKVVSAQSAYFSGVAERNGYRPDVVLAFMDNQVEVKIGDKVVHPKGAVLSLNAKQATEIYGGKPLLAKGIAETLEELLSQTGLAGAEIVRIEPTGFEQTAFWITRLAPILLMIGMVGIWVEIKTPGFGLPGIAAVTAFAIFFIGHYLAGLAGWELPVLFALGLVLILVELVFFPGLLIVAGIGLALVGGTLIWAMVDRYPSQPWWESANLLAGPMTTFFIAILITLGVMWALARYLPRTRLFRALVLETENPAGPAFVPHHNEFTDLRVGDKGVACSMLRPSGRGQFDGKARDVISNGSFVDPGTPIHVIAVEGSRIVVEPISDAAEE